MKKVTYIIPVNNAELKAKEYFRKAVESLKTTMGNNEYDLIIAGENNVSDILSEIAKEYVNPDNITVMSDIKDSDVFKVINQAVNLVTTEYFSVLEFDDAFMPKAYDNFITYSNYETEPSVYMPITILSDAKKDGQPVGLVNEIAWASSFAEEYGYLDQDALQTYPDFNVTGAFINTEDFISIGRLKPSFNLVAWYEMLMRMVFNEKSVYVIPKIGYVHTVGRDGSLMETIAHSDDNKLIPKLVELAPSESQYREERELDLTNKEEEKTEA